MTKRLQKQSFCFKHFNCLNMLCKRILLTIFIICFFDIYKNLYDLPVILRWNSKNTHILMSLKIIYYDCV